MGKNIKKKTYFVEFGNTKIKCRNYAKATEVYNSHLEEKKMRIIDSDGNVLWFQNFELLS